MSASDRSIRPELLERLSEQDWTDFGTPNVIITDGVARFWGLVGSEEERKVLIALAETVRGLSKVFGEMIPALIWTLDGVPPGPLSRRNELGTATGLVC
jgi:hypothetical protein